MARQLRFFPLRLTCPKVIFLLLAATTYFCWVVIFKFGQIHGGLPNFRRNSVITASPRFLSSAASLVSTQQNFTPEDGSRTEGTLGTLISTSRREINPHPFRFTILETETCQNVNSSMPLLLVIVHSDPRHHDFRTAIRETWANENASQYGLDSHMEMRVLFTMGSIPDDQYTMEKVKNESQIYHDIIQENFIDTYRNLTHKVVMWLKWATFYCSNAYRILKVDDDVFVNRFSVLQTVRGHYDRASARNQIIFCRVWEGTEVQRDRRSKWHVTTDEFEGRVYPPYCAGGAYMLSGDLPKLLYEKSAETRFFWVDDAYATGLLREKTGKITLENIGHKFVFFGDEFRSLGNTTKNALYLHLKTRSKPQYDWWDKVLWEYGVREQLLP